MQAWICILFLFTHPCSGQLQAPPHLQSGSFCTGLGAFDLVDTWYEWSQKTLPLDLSVLIANLRKMVNLIVPAIAIIDSNMQYLRNHTAISALVDRPDVPHARRYLYKKASSTPLLAIATCFAVDGTLPIIRTRDDLDDLDNLLVKQGMSSTLLDIELSTSSMWDRIGGYTYDKFLQSTTKPSSASWLNLAIYLKVGTNVSTELMLTTQENVTMDYLCEIPTLQADITGAAHKTTLFWCGMTQQRLGTLHTYVLTMLQRLRGKKLMESTSYPTYSDNNTVPIVVTGNVLQMDGIAYEVKRLGNREFWDTIGLTQILYLRRFINAADKYLSGRTLTPLYFDLPLTYNLERALAPRPDRQVRAFADSLASGLMKVVRFVVGMLFDSDIVTAILYYIITKLPTKLYMTRPFMNKDGDIMSDNYLLMRKRSSYTTLELPSLVGCESIRGFKVCRRSTMGSGSSRNYGCGRSIALDLNQDTCARIPMPERLIMYGSVPCVAVNTTLGSGVSDVAIAKEESELEALCGTGGDYLIKLRRGTNVLNSKFSKGCSMRFEGKFVLKRPSYAPLVLQGGTIIEGPTTSGSQTTISTIFGPVTASDLVTVITLLTVSCLLLGCCCFICCCPCVREKILDKLGCVILKDGCRDWFREQPACCCPMENPRNRIQEDLEMERRERQGAVPKKREYVRVPPPVPAIDQQRPPPGSPIEDETCTPPPGVLRSMLNTGARKH